MTKSERFEPLVRLAEDKEQQAAKALGDGITLLDQQRQRLQTLVDYRAEYTRHYHEAGAAGFSAARMVDYQAFLARLDQAISEQQQLIAQVTRHVDEKRRLWQDSHTRSQALDKAVTHLRQDECREGEKRAQSEMDEHAAQFFARFRKDIP